MAPDPVAIPVRQPAWSPAAATGGTTTFAPQAWRPAEVRTQNPILRYWQGGYPLGPSYWLVNVLIGVGLEIGLPLAIQGLDPDDTIDPGPRFTLLAGGRGWRWRVSPSGSGWASGGLRQRRAEERRRFGPNAFWPRLAQVMVVPPLLFDGFILYFIVVFAGVYYPIAFQGDPDIPDYTVNVLQDGKALSVVGGIKFGLVHDIEAVLNDNPAVRTIYLQSPGGRLGAGPGTGGAAGYGARSQHLCIGPLRVGLHADLRRRSQAVAASRRARLGIPQWPNRRRSALGFARRNQPVVRRQIYRGGGRPGLHAARRSSVVG